MTEQRIEAASAFNAWRRAKDRLRAAMDPRDFKAFIRPMLLLISFERTLCLTLPPNHRMFERAWASARMGLLGEAIEAQGYKFGGLAVYPSDDALLRFPAHWLPLLAKPLRARYEQARIERIAEDARDSMEAA